MLRTLTRFFTRHEQANVGRAQLAQKPETLSDAACLNDATQPIRQILSEANLNAAPAFDPAHQCERGAAMPEDSGRLEHAGRARAALDDRRERRHVRIELGFEPHLAREVGVREIDRCRPPDREIYRAAHARRHRLRHRHR
jgi:hypothetical protein